MWEGGVGRVGRWGGSVRERERERGRGCRLRARLDGMMGCVRVFVEEGREGEEKDVCTRILASMISYHRAQACTLQGLLRTMLELAVGVGVGVSMAVQ